MKLLRLVCLALALALLFAVPARAVEFSRLNGQIRQSREARRNMMQVRSRAEPSSESAEAPAEPETPAESPAAQPKLHKPTIVGAAKSSRGGLPKAPEGMVHRPTVISAEEFHANGYGRQAAEEEAEPYLPDLVDGSAIAEAQRLLDSLQHYGTFEPSEDPYASDPYELSAEPTEEPTFAPTPEPTPEPAAPSSELTPELLRAFLWHAMAAQAQHLTGAFEHQILGLLQEIRTAREEHIAETYNLHKEISILRQEQQAAFQALAESEKELKEEIQVVEEAIQEELQVIEEELEIPAAEATPESTPESTFEESTPESTYEENTYEEDAYEEDTSFLQVREVEDEKERSEAEEEGAAPAARPAHRGPGEEKESEEEPEPTPRADLKQRRAEELQVEQTFKDLLSESEDATKRELQNLREEMRGGFDRILAKLDAPAQDESESSEAEAEAAEDEKPSAF